MGLVVLGDMNMKIELKCGCKAIFNKRKKTLTIFYICPKHFVAIVKKVRKAMWEGFPDPNPTHKPFGKPLLTPAVLKQYREFMAPYETLTVSPNTLFWLRWLEKQRGKAHHLRLTLNGKTYPIIPTVTEDETSKPNSTK